MFAYVRLCSLYWKKIVEAPILISDASVLGSPLKKRAFAALGERRPVYFRGKTASPTAATVSSEFFKGRLALRVAGWRRTGSLAAPGPVSEFAGRRRGRGGRGRNWPASKIQTLAHGLRQLRRRVRFLEESRVVRSAIAPHHLGAVAAGVDDLQARLASPQLL